MIALFYNALTATILTGMLLPVGGVWRYLEEIKHGFSELAQSLKDNGLRILAFSFLVLFAITLLAGIGLI